jgi:hypothetical protein
MALGLGLSLVQAAGLQAGTVNGTQAISDNGAPSINTSLISTATIFNLQTLQTTGSNTGDFHTYAASGLALGSATLDLSNIAGFTFGSSTFGTFVATSLQVLPGSATSVNFYILGKFTPGSIFPSTLQDPGTASFTLGFTQTGGANSAISASGTLAIPPAQIVPEPGTLGALVFGFAALSLIRARKSK